MIWFWGLRQNLGGVVPVTASIDPYNAAASMSTLNGTDQFGGAKALEVSRANQEIKQGDATLPMNAQPPPQMYQASNGIEKGYVGKKLFFFI